MDGATFIGLITIGEEGILKIRRTVRIGYGRIFLIKVIVLADKIIFTIFEYGNILQESLTFTGKLHSFHRINKEY
ncbi:MAG TPA: hypothetical protein DFI01_00235 [Bacteroidales bacterium]|nr:hypothetical protein [Bacteroidales bacterium]